MDVSTRTDALQESLDELVTLACRELRAIAHSRPAARGGDGTLSTKSRVLVRRALES